MTTTPIKPVTRVSQSRPDYLASLITKISELDGLSTVERQNRLDMYRGNEIRELRRELKEAESMLQESLNYTKSLTTKLNNYLQL